MVKVLTPLTGNAQKFCDHYGNRFSLTGVAQTGVGMNLLSLATGQRFKIEKREGGIFIDGVLFCLNW